MATFKVNKKRDYTVLSNTPLREKNMSLKAKGLLCLMLSLPEDWDYSIPGLCAICKENETAVKSALNELKEFGYLVVEKQYPNQTQSGHIEYVYNIYEEPISSDECKNNDSSEEQGGQDQGVGNLCLENMGLNINTNQSNTTHVSSKDDTFDKGPSRRSARSETSTSGKLFSSAKPTTRKSSVQKTNNFISACQREAVKKEFSKQVLTALDGYFRMLAELNCLLPAVSIAEQLVHLAKVPQDRQVAVVKNTISRGWKSLQYEAEAITTGGASRNSSFVDTSTPGTFTATPEEEKNSDWKKDIPDDHIF